MEEIKDKIRNLTYVLVVGFTITTILLIGLYFKGNNPEVSDTKTDTKTSTGTNPDNNETDNNIPDEYDVSKMQSVTIKETEDLFSKKGTYILYIGRKGCSYCRKTVPVLNEVQTELGYKTYYFDISTTTNYKTELKTLADKMDFETSANGTKGKMGELFISKGWTPTIIVIKDGKNVDGFFGYKDKDYVKTLVSKYLK